MKIPGHFSTEINKLGSYPDGQRIEDYIYSSGRSAVAHANTKNLYSVDPDDPLHDARLRDDLPVIRELAKQVIINEFGVQSRECIWQSKTHAIAGAIWSTGDTVYQEISKGNLVGRRALRLADRVDLRVRGREQYQSLKSLKLFVCQIREQVALLKLSSDDFCLELFLEIDFQKGRLVFEPFANHVCEDNGCSASASTMADICAFWAEVFGNGQTQLIESETERVLAEADPYMPLNMMLNHEVSKKEIEYWRDLAVKRQKEEGKQKEAG